MPVHKKRKTEKKESIKLHQIKSHFWKVDWILKSLGCLRNFLIFAGSFILLKILHKNSTSLTSLTIAASTCSVKPFSKDVATPLKLTYK